MPIFMMVRAAEFRSLNRFGMVRVPDMNVFGKGDVQADRHPPQAHDGNAEDGG